MPFKKLDSLVCKFAKNDFRIRRSKADSEKEARLFCCKIPNNNALFAFDSGRDKETLTKWLGNLNVILIAEHGVWTKQQGLDWQSVEHIKKDWKDTIRPVLELYADRTPGSFVEEKDFSLVWHYRRASSELAYIRIQELRGALLNLTANLNVGVFEGSKILEIKHISLNKGRAAECWLAEKNWDFIIAAGDDYTDEEMFAVLPEKAYSIKVGFSVSKARFNVDTVHEIRLLIKELTGD